MRNYKKLILPFILGLIIICQSCKEEQAPVQNMPSPKVETPKTLKNNEQDIKISLSGRSYRKDILSLLLDERLRTDQDFKNLIEQINSIENQHHEAFKPLNNYSRNHIEYWANAQSLIKQIKDSTLQKEMKSSFIRLKSNQNQTLAEHHETESIIKKKKAELEDQFILLKLAVTHNMMESYQENEFPTIDPLKNLLVQYEKLIQETKDMRIEEFK